MTTTTTMTMTMTMTRGKRTASIIRILPSAVKRIFIYSPSLLPPFALLPFAQFLVFTSLRANKSVRSTPRSGSMFADRRSANAADSLLPRDTCGRCFWVVISSNPANGVVYLAIIFIHTRLAKRDAPTGGPSVRHFYVTFRFYASLSSSLSSPSRTPLSLPMTRVPFASIAFDLKGGFIHTHARYL